MFNFISQIFSSIQNVTKIKEEAEDRKKMETAVYQLNIIKKKLSSISHGPANKQHT